MIEVEFDNFSPLSKREPFNHVELPGDVKNSVLKRQNEFVAGRMCAAIALTKIKSAETHVGRRTDRSPIWPQGFLGSITHISDLAAAIVCREGECVGIGLDYEYLTDLTRADELADMIMTSDELLKYRLLKDSQRAKVWTLTFSAKESFFKAAFGHVQKVFGFGSAKLHNLNGFTFNIEPLGDLSEVLGDTVITGHYILVGRIVKTLVIIQKF